MEPLPNQRVEAVDTQNPSESGRVRTLHTMEKTFIDATRLKFGRDLQASEPPLPQVRGLEV